MPSEGLRLVEQIETSISAMDTLFSAILDISRLDAGVVDVHPKPFPIQPLLDRICLDHAEEASAKGVRLISVPCGAVVHADPVLIERILRNLVSNAVRYTERGRVVVGCRRGSALRIEVWDTGPGIPPDQRERIFQEYFQLGNPERDRAKGLGLGLAIVRRLTTLLGCELVLRSEWGRGSCFSVAVPRADAADEAAGDDDEVSAGMFAGGLVLVIDDEVAIREAMAALLTGWGHEVVTAASGEEILARVVEGGARPDLIICDYRLRAGETGLEVIDSLRSEYNATIPAMLITGDTAPDRLAEARASGLLLLHKPVPNGKLRAAVAHLMQWREDQAAEAYA
jgi:CheY-like chemotaxis protein